MASLQQHFEQASEGEGHCILLSGEAGIGKTALVKEFCKLLSNTCAIYQGACDDLFTPRPLAPLYDVLWQVNKERWTVPPSHEERSVLFTNFFQELSTKKSNLLIVFEDMHWADEGTLDFIKFFVRRLGQLPCLFILTYRDSETNLTRPLRNVLGELPPDSFTKMALTPLSKHAVEEMATQKGYNGEDVYKISGGNPFYVNEILASYSPGVPEKIKNSILSVYERQKEGTRNAWEIWSIMPDGLEVEYVPRVKSSWVISNCFAIGVIIIKNGKVVFKHELYRRTIEESLTSFKKIELNKKMLELFLETFEAKGEIERILHYAKNANEKDMVVKYAAAAAGKAASTGAHKEASKLWLTAIEYVEGKDIKQLTEFYEAYSYECYLSNQIKEAISFTEKVLDIRKKETDIDEITECLCFLSRLWRIEGDRKNAERFAAQAIELVKELQSPSMAKSLAYSNISEIKMLYDNQAEYTPREESTIEIATESGNEKMLCRAMNAFGALQMLIPGSEDKGIALLQQCLEIALKNGYYEHAAATYANLAGTALRIKKYELASRTLEAGILYSEERGLSFWNAYLLSQKAKLELEKGNLPEAWKIADNLLKNENQPHVIKITTLNVLARIAMRRGDDALALLPEVKTMSFAMMEPQRVIAAMATLFEYEWLTGKTVIEKDDIEQTSALIPINGMDVEKSELTFWMLKAGRHFVLQNEIAGHYDVSSEQKVMKAAAFWEQSGCPYEQALVLFEGNEDEKRKAIAIVQDLDVIAVFEKMKQEMRDLGIKNIPRGIRNSTRSNAALLTTREMEILKLLSQDLQNKEIAAQLFISAKTVDHHISNILVKLDTNSRHKAVAEALRMGILK